MKVLCIGHASYDISMILDSFPKENTKYRLNKKEESPGGPALTESMLLGSWGVDVYYEGVLGRDIYASLILEELKKRNVNTKYVKIKNDIETTKTFVLINKMNASRTLFNCSIDDSGVVMSDYDFTPDIILMDGMHYNIALKACQKFPNAIKVLDAGSATTETMSLARISNYIICSKEFAEVVSKQRIDYKNPDTLKEVINTLIDIYKGQVIITSEEKGCIYKIEDKIKMMSGIKVHAKDTTGAGDIFHGAFVYGLTKNLPLEKCLKIANIAAGLSVKELGVVNSIPQIEEVYKIYEKNR